MMKSSILLAGAALFALGGVATAQEYPSSPAADPAAQTPAPAEPATPPDASVGTTAPTAPDAGTTAPTTATEPAPPATPETPATTATPTAPSGTPGTPAPEAPAATATTGASATVQADWAKYDKDSDGGLTPLEFGEWILASRGQDMTAEVEKTRQSKKADLPAVKVLNATAGEFSKADADKDRKISQTELTTYLAA